MNKFNTKKYLEDLASTPLMSLANGEETIDLSKYIVVEEIKFESKEAK